MKITLLTGRTFDFQDRFGFEIKTVKSSRAKRLTIRIDEKNHRAVLTIPKYCTQKHALQFLTEHQDWITNMLARLPKTTKFGNGDTLSFFGKEYIISQSPEQKGSCFCDNLLKIGGAPEFLHRRVTDFLKKQTLDLLTDLTLEKAKILNCSVNGVCIKDTKSRWGSCSTLGNINYNWRISFAPLPVIDYLVCHEVSHLKHPDHSPAFWQTVASLCPDYKTACHWLKVKGKDLYQYL